MLVTKDNYGEVLTILDGWSELSLDCETTGLRPYLGHRPFSIIVSNGNQSFYFPIMEASGLKEFLNVRRLAEYLESKPRTVYLQNAKFDLHHLSCGGVELHSGCNIVDTAVLARLHHSDLKSYSLEFLAEHYLGEPKGKGPMDYVKEHGLKIKDPEDPRKTGFDYLVQFEKIPIEIMLPYAEQDAKLTFNLAKTLLGLLAKADEGRPVGRASNVHLVTNESDLTSVVFRMEKVGVRVDRIYAEEGLAYEQNRFERGKQEFERKVGEPYVPSSPRFARILQAHGIDAEEFAYSNKQNIICDGKTLSRIGGDIAECILAVKDAKSRSNFFAGFCRFTDRSNRIHCDYKQGGTVTGRFSSSSPNLQNLTKPDEDETVVERYPIRRAIVPDNDRALVMFDYSQMEYRLMLDYANQTDLIEKIMAGLDLHQSTADLVGISRTHAKTLNFAILFGAGSVKIAGMLGVTPDESKDLIHKFYRGLPQVDHLIRRVRKAAKERLCVYNWFGRKMTYSDPNHSYKAVNHLIQGGCADILRIAMVNIDKLLKNYKSTMNLTIHDELVFNIPEKEFHLIPTIKAIMVDAYPHKHLPMDVTISHSWKSLGDKKKGSP